MSETGFSAQKYADVRKGDLEAAAAQTGPMAVAEGITANVIKNTKEQTLAPITAEFNVNRAKNELKQSGAGEKMVNIGSWVVESLAKFYDHRVKVDSDKAVYHKEWANGKLQKRLDVRGEIAQRRADRSTHLAEKSHAKVVSPDTISFQNPLKRLEGLKRIFEEVNIKWNEVFGNLYDKKAANLATKAERYTKTSESLYKVAAKIIGDSEAFTANTEMTARKSLTEMKAKLKEATAKRKQAEKEMSNLEKRKYLMPEAKKATDAATEAGLSKKAAKLATEIQAQKMSKAISGGRK